MSARLKNLSQLREDELWRLVWDALYSCEPGAGNWRGERSKLVHWQALKLRLQELEMRGTQGILK